MPSFKDLTEPERKANMDEMNFKLAMYAFKYQMPPQE